MLLGSSWTKVTTVIGYGAQIQKHGLVNIQVAYSATSPVGTSIHVIRDGNLKTFQDTLPSDFIWARSLVRDTTISVVEIDLTVGPTKRVIISRVEDFPTTLLSTVQYFIDGIVQMGARSLEVPADGLHLAGLDLELSFLVSNEPNYTMFTSPVGGSGDVLGLDYAVTVSGVNSRVYDITDSTGFHAIEVSRVNYTDCTSLGVITDYRQGLETGTGRFGGTPSLTLAGNWVGGFRLTTTIVRSLDASMTEPLFKAGAGFSMNSRFLTDINVDLPPLAALADFSTSHFPNPSTFQVQGAIITRGFNTNADDSNIFPNILPSDLAASWTNNQGVRNTFTGGRCVVSAEVDTIIAVEDEFVPLAGTRTASELQHFDSPANGQLRQLGNNPREYTVVADKTLKGKANDDLTLKLVRWDDSSSTFVTEYTQTRPVNNLSGGRDVAFFTIMARVEMDADDYVFFEVANNTGTDNVTAQADSFFVVQQR